VKPHSTEFTIQPEKNTFCLGDQVNLTCKADAVPPAEFSLYLNSHVVQNRNTGGSIIVLFTVKGENDFTCVPNNTAGIGQTKSVKVFVKGILCFILDLKYT
jgi:hypothetical protein